MKFQPAVSKTQSGTTVAVSGGRGKVLSREPPESGPRRLVLVVLSPLDHLAMLARGIVSCDLANSADREFSSGVGEPLALWLKTNIASSPGDRKNLGTSEFPIVPRRSLLSPLNA